MSEWNVDFTHPSGSMGERHKVEAKSEGGARRKARALMTAEQKGWTVTVSLAERKGP